MAGKPGRSGGKRDGSGRPKVAEKTYQETMRAKFQECVTTDDWREAVGSMVRLAKRGDVAAFKVIEPWVMGKVPNAVMLTGADGGPLEVAVREIVVALPKRAAE